MTAPINDGGQAFPAPDTMHASGHDGMSLRDWFAGLATDEDVDYVVRDMAAIGKSMTRERARYMHADAMLAEREKGGGA